MKKNIMLIMALLGSGVFYVSTGQAQVRQPNIIFMLMDDVGYAELSCHGNPILKTPNLDKLAERSVQLENYHVAPTCAPTRAQLMTGMHEFMVGVTHTKKPWSEMSLSTSTLGNVMQEAGYQTGMFGKWHLGMKQGADAYAPYNRGFDVALTAIEDSQSGKFDPELIRNGVVEPHTGYRTDIFFDEAMKWMDAQGDQPFFCYIPTYNAHNPVQAPEPFSAPFYEAGMEKKQAEYYGMISNFDTNAGRLMAWLAKSGKMDNTIVIYSTDNGHAISGAKGAGHDSNTGFLKEGGLYNAGMRGGKCQHWRGSSRVPFFISGPGVGAPGTVVERVTGSIDVLPTLAELTGATVPECVQGKSLVPLFHNPKASWPARYLVVHRARWEPPETAESCKYREVAIQSDRYRLCQKSADEAPELFDHELDPGETTDISAQHPERMASMQAYYDEFWAKARPKMANEISPDEVAAAVLNKLKRGKGNSKKKRKKQDNQV
jgi:arylsulfatase A-like enzyme